MHTQRHIRSRTHQIWRKKSLIESSLNINHDFLLYWTIPCWNSRLSWITPQRFRHASIMFKPSATQADCLGKYSEGNDTNPCINDCVGNIGAIFGPCGLRATKIPKHCQHLHECGNQNLETLKALMNRKGSFSLWDCPLPTILGEFRMISYDWAPRHDHTLTSENYGIVYRQFWFLYFQLYLECT